MSGINLPIISNAGKINICDVPCLPISEFREAILQMVDEGGRVAAFFGKAEPNGFLRLFAVIANSGIGKLQLCCADVKDSYLSLTPECPQLHLFEREIAEQYNIVPQGHPWLKPVRFPNGNVGITNFFQIEGEEIHEVAVGPVHAGIIEPGHFRFQCNGERVFHLEISLGYQHRGIEKELQSGINKRTIHYMETLAGDTTIGHTLAYCQAVEALTQTTPPVLAQTIAAIALELERLANHTGDLGALAGDIGYLPTASYCGRIRGDFLNMTALICGNRFGRGLLVPGGAGFDIEKTRAAQLMERLERASKDVTGAVNLLWETHSVLSRFEETGKLERETAEELGIVGPAARACGIERDVRFEFPAGIYRFAQIPVSLFESGDVFARAYVRWLEIQRSIKFVNDLLKSLNGGGQIKLDIGNFTPDSLTVSLVEGWRGEICHVAITNELGKISTYKVVDPSFHNWTGLAMALREQSISDFPLCNKSFNLSYCGHDL